MILTETRWKCDYCGNVSPVVRSEEQKLMLWNPGYSIDEFPPGWVVMPDGISPSGIKQFCCKAHKQAWLKEREAA